MPKCNNLAEIDAQIARQKHACNEARRKTFAKRKAQEVRLAAKDIHKVAAMNTLTEILINKSSVRHLIYNQVAVIERQLKRDGIASFVTMAEQALLMSIKGFTTAKTTYNKDNEVTKVVEEYIPPNYQAAIAFLKYMCPEKYGRMDGGNAKHIYNIISVDNIDKDLARLTRVAGNLMQAKMIESVEVESEIIEQKEELLEKINDESVHRTSADTEAEQRADTTDSDRVL